MTRLSALHRAARLITITGPGGVGKTRFTLRAAAKLASRFDDGVYLVELAGLRDPELLPHTVATSLGLPEQDTRPQLDAVLTYLRDRNLLLILDTCEHLVDACSSLASTLLRSTAGVSVLATSRQPLDAGGESVFRLEPLPEPDAVELFAQRAATAVPEFAVTSANRADVVKLCRWLDGIPLAIELASVRLRAVPVDQLALRLENRFLLLTGERKDALPHHQTLRTAIGWSHDLCTPEQQLLWARLSVFAGTFDIADAEQVCEGPPLAEDDVLRTLIDLVDKSVVVLTADGRYRLLDTIREFGAERLAASGEEHAARARHVRRYAGMAQYFGAHPIGEDQLARYRELRTKHDNIRAALRYAFGAGEMNAEAASLATDLYAYWQISGLLAEGRYWMSKVLDRFGDPCPERAWALVMIGILAALQGEIPDALAVLDEGIPMAEQLGQDLTGSRGYGHRTLAYGFAGLADEAAAAGAITAERAALIGDEPGLVALHVELALLHLHNGDPLGTLEQARQGLARLPAGSAERWMQGWLNFYTGLAQFLLGEQEEATATLRTALTMKYELGDSVGIAYCLEVLGWVAAAWERYDRTAWLLGAADALWELAGGRLSSDATMEQFRQQAAKAASGALGAARYAALAHRGARDDLDHVVTLATGDEDAADAQQAAESADGPLTSRQRQIAALVAEGLSNREIAARLVISKRTVDAHIDHIFAKLGVSSRTQLAARLQGSR
jgi:non-specific serine/threonine protein kinase